MNNFNLGDEVILQKGNIPYHGHIIDAGKEGYKYFRPNSPTELAFLSDDGFHYFDWLDNAHTYLTHVK